MDIIEFADVLNVPILKAGAHNSRNAGKVEISPERLQQIAQDSMECKDLIKESIKTGVYRGNILKLNRPIPGPINFHHDDILDETIKDRVKDVDWSFDTREIDGEQWLTESFFGVPRDVAQSIQTHFPARSVELIGLEHPDKGIVYDMVVRSTAFLDRFTSPAVKGQNLDVTVEFAESDQPALYVFYSQDTSINSHEEDKTMSEKKDGKTPEAQKTEVSGADKDSKLKELQAELEVSRQELEKTRGKIVGIQELQQAREEDAKQIIELQKSRDAIELSGYMKELSAGILTNEGGQRYQTTPAFIELVEDVVRGVSRTDVIMLSDGKNHPARETLQELLLKVVEFAMNDKIVVCLSEIAPQHFSDPAKSGQKRDRMSLVKEFQAANPDITYAVALQRVSNDPANADVFATQ